MSNLFLHGSGGRPLSSGSPTLPRRLSYASVLAGNSSVSTPSVQQPLRSGFFAEAQGSTSSLAVTDQSSAPSHYHTFMRADEPQSSLSGRWQSNADPVDGVLSSRLPRHRDGLVPSTMERRIADFFVPSYLAESRHVERLEQRYKARLAAQRDGRQTRASNPGSLSTSASSMSLHKMVPSHRGMTHEIVERPAAHVEESLAPLPSKWSYSDKFIGLEIYNDGLDVKSSGTSKTQDEAAAIRANHPIPRECGIYYYEVTVLGKAREGLIGIGFSGSKVPLNRLPGWETDSWAYHGDDGYSFSQTASGKNYGPKFGFGDVIGCGINYRTGTAFFTKNGVHLGSAFRDIRGANLYPSIGMKKLGEHIRVNFGQTPFVFDIDGMVAQERERLLDEIHCGDSSALQDGGSEESLLQELVAQYLAHDGYMDTARAFSEEVRQTSRLLYASNHRDAKESEYKEDLDAINRQKIRAAILDGDVDKALKHTTAYYPSVLQENENIYFKLRCRKFIEMIRKCTDLQAPSTSAATKVRAAPAPHSYGPSSIKKRDSFDGYMDVDDDAPPPLPPPPTDDTRGDCGGGGGGGGGDDGMDGVEDSALLERQMQLMNEAVAYGQELQLEFKDDARREVKQALEDTFALIAYADARESSLAPLLELGGRVPVAEELNSAILVSLGKSSCAALERLCRQTEVLVDDLSEAGGAAALINVGREYLR